jgi:ATP-dependent Lhr-like helicase
MELTQSIACWLLYKEGYIEPPQKSEKPYDILSPSGLINNKGHSGIKLKDLINQLKENAAFKQIELSDIEQILNHLIEIDFPLKITQSYNRCRRRKVVNSRDFIAYLKLKKILK